MLQGTGVFTKFILIVLLFIIVFVVGVGALMQIFLRMLYGLRPGASRGPKGRPGDGRFGNERKAERMLACSVCGVHVPESEGVEAAGKFYCCEAHRK